MKYLALFVFLVTLSAAGQAKENAWQLKKQQDGVTVHQQKTGSGYPITRGSIEVDASADAIITLIRDSSACRRWLYQCKQSRLVKQYNAATRLDYTVIKSPLFFADRDLYTYAQLTFNRDTQTALIRVSGREAHDKGQPGKVRMKDVQGFWSMKKISPNKTALLYQIYSNPQLTASGFLNSHIVDSVFYTLKRLAVVSKEAKYKNAKVAELK